MTRVLQRLCPMASLMRSRSPVGTENVVRCLFHGCCQKNRHAVQTGLGNMSWRPWEIKAHWSSATKCTFPKAMLSAQGASQFACCCNWSLPENYCRVGRDYFCMTFVLRQGFYFLHKNFYVCGSKAAFGFSPNQYIVRRMASKEILGDGSCFLRSSENFSQMIREPFCSGRRTLSRWYLPSYVFFPYRYYSEVLFRQYMTDCITMFFCILFVMHLRCS